MKFKLLSVAVIALLITTVSTECLAQKAGAKPNILIILADDLGYHDVSYYGTNDIRTPNIDYLAKQGQRFDNFHANTVCSPSRASLLTGRYSDMVGVQGLIRSHADDTFGYLRPDAILLPKLLKSAGYHTALVGKWNLGLESPNKPNQKGFDVFHGFLDDMMDDYTSHLRFGNNFMRKNETIVDPKGHATDIFTQWAVDYIDQQKASKAPFFLYLAYNAPHAPIQPPKEWLDRVKAREPQLSDKRAKLVALIEHMDNGIGKVIDELKATNQYDNTIIIFLSDNGGNLVDGANNGTLRDGKQSMYEGGLRVPAVMVWQDHIKAGSINNQRAHLMDIYPTLAEITNIRINHPIDGISLRNSLSDPDAVLKERNMFFMRREGNMRYAGQTIQAVISGNYKLLQNSPFEPYELYNIGDDPEEKNNIIKQEPLVHRRLQMLLMNQIQKAGSVPWQKPN